MILTVDLLAAQMYHQGVEIENDLTFGQIFVKKAL